MHIEGVKCTCMGRGMVCIWKRLSVHGEREGVYMEGVECGCMGVCIWKGWSVRAWGKGGCVQMKGSGVRAWGEVGCVHMEGVKCTCMGRGCVGAWGDGGCVCGSRGAAIMPA